MMMRVFQVCLLMGAMVAAGCQSQPETVTRPGHRGEVIKPLTIHAAFHGSQSAMGYPTVTLIRSREHLDALELSVDEGALDAIDFTQHAIVLVGLGQRPTGGFWVHLHAAQLGDGVVFVQGKINSPAPDDMVTQALTHPFYAIVIDRLPEQTRIVFEPDTVIGQAMPASPVKPAP